METFPAVSRGVDLDDAAHLSSILGRDAGSVDAHGLNIVGLNLRSMARRSVVGERNSVEHKLGLVFRAARMKDRVAFVQPSRLRVHQVLQRTARQRRDAIGNRLRADLVDRTDAMRIDERVVGLHLDGRLEGRQSRVLQADG